MDPGLVSGEDGIPLSGRTVPFDAATIAELYPEHATYVDAVRTAAGAAVAAGWLLDVDAERLVAEADASPIGR